MYLAYPDLGIIIKSNQIKSNQIKSNQIKSNQIKSNQIDAKSALVVRCAQEQAGVIWKFANY
jgi:hypothetical protein